MEESKVNITLPEGYAGQPIEVILREGPAPKPLDPKYPEIINIAGIIDSPFRWLEQRINLIDQKNSNIIVCRDDITIVLVTGEKDYYKDTIAGKLETSKKIIEFGINTGKEWDPIKLSQFFKMNRAFFPDKSENMRLVTVLKNFRASINQEVERSKEETGSKTDNFSQIVNSNLPASFKVSLPLFKGHPCEDIEVEIYADIDGRDISLTLVSAGAEELLEEYRNRIIDDLVDAIRMIAPGIVIIEK